MLMRIFMSIAATSMQVTRPHLQEGCVAKVATHQHWCGAGIVPGIDIDAGAAQEGLGSRVLLGLRKGAGGHTSTAT